MALPLPRVISDVGPGGPLVTAMGGMNALANNNILRQMNQVKKQYLPVTMQADAASKLAYANLMGPQFLAKIMGNDSALANMSEDQKRASLDKIYQAGSGQGSGANALNQVQQPQTYSGIGQPSTNSFSGYMSNALKNVMDAFGVPSSSKQNAMSMGDQSSSMGQANTPAPPDEPSKNDDIDHELDAGWMDWMNSPESKAPGAVPPSAQELRARYRNKVLGKPSVDMELTEGQSPTRKPTYAENTASYKSILEEGKETGKIRAKQREELDDQYQQALQSEVPLQHLNDIVTNPLFQKLRRDGAFQKLQLDTKEIIGSKEEKKLIGDFQATAMKAVAETIMGFRGRILDKEVSLANDMKVSPKDSIDAILGKLPSIETFNEMTKERSRIASKLMRDMHLSKGDALEEADSRLNGKKIREKIEKELNTYEKPKSQNKKPILRYNINTGDFEEAK